MYVSFYQLRTNNKTVPEGFYLKLFGLCMIVMVFVVCCTVKEENTVFYASVV